MTSSPESVHNRLQNELPYFSRQALFIKDKSGFVIPFIFNAAQRYIDSRLEEQMMTLGRVRALILKGRQQGCSSYIAARFYHKSTRHKGKSVFILSHEAKTTEKLFSIVERFQTNCPEPLRPSTTIQNRRELLFDKIEGDYSVGTAGNEKVGRGGTLQYLHGSEVAFWEKTEGIQTGIMQSVADADATEIILESTANGLGNMFHGKCMLALEGKGDYILIFIPWFWQKEYTRTPSDDFRLESDEFVIKEAFKLTDGQICWRRMKIFDLQKETGGDGLRKFHQEYPCTIQEAFISSGEKLIDGDKLLAARKSQLRDRGKPLIVGVDPGRTGDRCIIVRRYGREIPNYETFPYTPQMQMSLAGRLASMIDRENVTKMFIDVAHGYGTIDRLNELGYKGIVQGVHFSEKPLAPEKFLNKRSEMHMAVRDWIEEGGVSVPDDPEFHADLACIPDYEQTSRQLIFIKPKKEIKKILGKSPDIMDAVALTFAYPVRSAIQARRGPIRQGKNVSKGKGSLTTLNRTRRQPNQSAEVSLSMVRG